MGLSTWQYEGVILGTWEIGLIVEGESLTFIFANLLYHEL